jgi:hypothetical protein
LYKLEAVKRNYTIDDLVIVVMPTSSSTSDQAQTTSYEEDQTKRCTTCMIESHEGGHIIKDDNDRS